MKIVNEVEIMDCLAQAEYPSLCSTPEGKARTIAMYFHKYAVMAKAVSELFDKEPQ